MNIAIALSLGLLAGALSGALGVGGGLLTIPGMVLLLGTDQHVAQGSALWAIVPTALIGTFVHYRGRNLSPRLVLWIAPAAALSALLGAWAASLLNSRVLTLLFACLLLVIGCRTLATAKEDQGVGPDRAI